MTPAKIRPTISMPVMTFLPSVAGDLFRTQVRTEGDQFRKVVDGGDGPGVLDAHEPVRIKVVAEQQRRVRVGRCEQARPPVVEEVALVDRLDPECVALLAEARENR